MPLLTKDGTRGTRLPSPPLPHSLVVNGLLVSRKKIDRGKVLDSSADGRYGTEDGSVPGVKGALSFSEATTVRHIASAHKRGAAMIDERLLKILVCPQCHGELALEDDRLVCQACGLRYPIRDGIPVMLIEEAEAPGAPTEGGEPPAS